MSNLVTTASTPEYPNGDPLSKIERGAKLLESLGCLDNRAKMLISDAVLNQIAGNRATSSGERMMTLSDGFMELTSATAKEATILATKNGKMVKSTFFNETNNYPSTHKQLVNGRSVDVCDYPSSFLEKYKEALENFVIAHRS